MPVFFLVLVFATHSMTSPPTSLAGSAPEGEVRACAEWEPAFGTLIRWPLGIPSSLVIELAKDDILYVLVDNSSAETQARTTFSSWGIDLDQVHFTHTSTNSKWTRDWGPHSIFVDGEWAITDPIFDGYPWVPNEPTPGQGRDEYGSRGWEEDDVINIDVAADLGAPLYSMPAYATGGNLMVDGHGIGFSTRQMVDENLQVGTEEQFFERMNEYLGITTYHILDNTERNGIQHIDCWGKLLDEETILVKSAPSWHYEHDHLENNVAILEGLTNVYGRPYRIVRIDCPAFNGGEIAAYTNSLILNGKVLVPTFGISADEAALENYREAMPGYEVIGFDYNSWYYYDALHCRTRAIYDRHMLRVLHRRLDDQVEYASGHRIEVRFDDRSETGLVEEELAALWRLEGAGIWNEVPLTPTGEPDLYEGTLPGVPSGSVVEYYVRGSDSSGRVESLPRTAPAGFYRFEVVQDPASLMDAAGDGTRLVVGPNPLVKESRVRWQLPDDARFRIDVLDVQGRIVRHLAEGRGPDEVLWDGRGDSGQLIPAGIFWVRLIAGEEERRVRLIRLR